MATSQALSRLLLILLCGLLMAQSKGINVIPRRDDIKLPPPPLAVAEQAYRDGIVSHERAQATTREKKRNRLLTLALQRYDVAHRYASGADSPPPFSHDLYSRISDALLAQGNIGDARKAAELALGLRPEHPPTLYRLATVQVQQRDFDGLRDSFAVLWREAEVNGEAWQYIDRLLADLDTFIDRQDDISAGLRRWHEEQQVNATETVRWTTLPDD
ncbi:MAG: hypothetical protein KJO55_10225 [Gammaproteobacteria bacterium]|nr:hypothetical protein [Gammaproteobacteria bacterium]